MLCGTEPFPEKFKAKKVIVNIFIQLEKMFLFQYKIHEHFITKKNFFHMMTNLPEKVGPKT